MPQEFNSGEFISLAQAISYVEAFRKFDPDGIHAYNVDGSKLQQVLDQQDCVGVRIYNGYDEAEKRINLVIIGVDSGNRDMDNGLILEKFSICPPNCGSGALTLEN